MFIYRSVDCNDQSFSIDLYYLYRAGKNPVARKNRQWSDEEILEMMDKINNGYTYQDCTDGTHVPISTLWSR